MLHAYRFGADDRLIDLGLVDVARAVTLLDESVVSATLDCHYVEESLAATAFTLANQYDSSLDVSAFAPARIHVTFEGTELIEPRFFGFMRVPFTYERMLSTKRSVIELIERFSMASDSEMKEYVEARWGRESRWDRLRRGA